jgi:eukaryotic-like serine/threonine-protein kinase
VISAPDNDRPITHPEWTRDGKSITYLWGEGSAPKSLWMRPLAADSKPRMIVQPASAQSDIDDYRVSPDGRWVAYTSDESGQWEIYLTTFPEGKGKWKVSDNGGNYPAWSGNGKELFYQDITENFFVCPLAIKGSDVEIGRPRHLFHAGTPGIGLPFDVSLDGKRLLVNHADEETQAPLHLVTNWQS